MANIKFFKKATRPTSAGVGSVWFDSTRKAIVLTGATADEDVIYSGCITNAVVEGEKLLLTKTDASFRQFGSLLIEIARENVLEKAGFRNPCKYCSTNK